MDNAVIDLEVQQGFKRESANNMNIVQNVAYESHVHQEAGINQDEYDYI